MYLTAFGLLQTASRQMKIAASALLFKSSFSMFLLGYKSKLLAKLLF